MAQRHAAAPAALISRTSHHGLVLESRPHGTTLGRENHLQALLTHSINHTLRITLAIFGQHPHLLTVQNKFVIITDPDTPLP